MSESKQSDRSHSERISVDSNTALQQQKQIDYLKNQIERINSKVERPMKESRPKSRCFEETKDLIRKLEETESKVRRNRPGNM